jgi:hypothetical protein
MSFDTFFKKGLYVIAFQVVLCAGSCATAVVRRQLCDGNCFAIKSSKYFSKNNIN